MFYPRTGDVNYHRVLHLAHYNLVLFEGVYSPSGASWRVKLTVVVSQYLSPSLC